MEKIKNLKLTATTLAKFEEKLGMPLTRFSDAEFGMRAWVLLLESAGMTDEEIDEACDELGIEKFSDTCVEAMMNCGLFKQAKAQQTKAQTPKSK